MDIFGEREKFSIFALVLTTYFEMMFNNFKFLAATLLLVGAFSCAPKVSFYATTLPEIEGVTTDVATSREGDEWQVNVKVKNTTSESVTIKVKLAAEPRFKATQYLFPGINYNGNGYGSNLDLPQSYGDSKGFIPFPQGWEYKGEPWVFAYDRGSIPSCTISENEANASPFFRPNCRRAVWRSINQTKAFISKIA